MLKWIKKLFNSSLEQPDEWFKDALGVSSGAGPLVNQETALKVSAVYACVRVIAESVSMLPLNVYERDSGNGREIARDHPLHRLLHDMPNTEQTAFDLHDYMISRVLLKGTSYAQINRTRLGAVGEIIPLTGDVRVDRDASDNLIYFHTPLGSGTEETFRDAQIWRVTGFSSNGITGLSPIGLARESIGQALAGDERSSSMLANGAVVPNVFEIPVGLSDQAYERLKDHLLSEHAGAKNSGKPLILEEGLTFKSIGLNNVDAQFLENRKYNVIDITRWFRVPPHLISELEHATFSNIEHQEIQFLTHTLGAWLSRYRQSIYRDLLSQTERQKYFADFVTDGLLRTDIKSRNEAYAMQIQNGIRNRNEVRALENLNAVEGGDEFLTPGNMMSDAQRASSAASDHHKQLVIRAHQRLATKEKKTVDTARKKHKEGEFKSWAQQYYRDHIHEVVDELFVEYTDAKQYCEAQLTEVLSGGWSQTRSDELYEVLADEV